MGYRQSCGLGETRPACALDRPPRYLDARAGSRLAFAYQDLIVMPLTVAVIAVPIPASAIMVIAMVPIWIAIVRAPTNVDANICSRLQIGGP
jgi:hypothetical protein